MQKWLRRAFVLAWCASPAWSVDWTALRPQGCLSDFAQVVDAGARKTIEPYCAAIEHATGVRMSLVTVSSLQREPIQDVANTIARAWQTSADGILFLMSIQDRRYQLASSPQLRSALPEHLNAAILREMRPALRRRDPGEAVMAAAETLGIALAQARHVSVDTRLPRRFRPGSFDAFSWWFVIGVVLLLVWLMRAGGPRGFRLAGGRGFLPWLALGAATTRSTWGSRGSGGFGGYDSGDTVTGFGGGDFGGAGASSDW